MFSGIIEEIGIVRNIQRYGGNVHLSVSCSFINELKIDQSMAHNGVCLTVVDLQPNHYVVTAIDETLRKSNLGLLTVGSEVNLERSMKLDGRLDGHIVQGHVDQTARCMKVEYMLHTGIKPSVSIPEEKVTACSYAMPTSKERLGEASVL